MTQKLTGPALVAYLRDNPTSDVMRAAADEIERLREAHDESESVLLRNGFVRCDIPACACGSWHPRYGLPERMREITDALAEAGHPLNNENGNLVINALGQLVAERDALREALKCIARTQTKPGDDKAAPLLASVINLAFAALAQKHGEKHDNQD